MMSQNTRINTAMTCMIALCVTLAGRLPAASIEQLKPVLDDQTFALVHVDVTRLDPDALAAYALGILGNHADNANLERIKADLEALRSLAAETRKAFLAAGGREVYLVFSMYDFPDYFTAVPAPAQGDRSRLLAFMQGSGPSPSSMGADDDLILCGDKTILDRVKSHSSTASVHFKTAFAALPDARALRVICAPSPDQRRILAEMLPSLPEAYEPILLGRLIAPLQWMTLAADGPPSLSLSLNLKTPGADEADQLLEAIGDGYAAIGRRTDVQKFMPNVARLLKRLTPSRAGSSLRLAMNRSMFESLLQAMVTPAFLDGHGSLARHDCRDNLVRLSHAIQNHANDYDDKYPPDFALLVKYHMSPAHTVCPSVKAKDSYVYRGAGLTVSAMPRMILAYDRLENHVGEGRNVLFLDNDVQWITEDRFQELIQVDNQYRRSHDLPEVPVLD